MPPYHVVQFEESKMEHVSTIIKRVIAEAAEKALEANDFEKIFSKALEAKKEDLVKKKEGRVR